MRGRGRPTGFTLIECLVLVMVLGIVAAAAGRMLQVAPQATTIAEATLRSDNALMGTIEALRAQSFASLQAVATGSATAANYYYDRDGNATTSLGNWTYQVSWTALTGSSLQLDASTTGNNDIVRVTATVTAVRLPAGTVAQSGPAMSTYVSQ